MKKYFLIILFLFSKVYADSENAIAGAALATGAMFGLAATLDSAVSPEEMRLFLDPQTNSTTQLTEMNGLLIESRLIEVVQGVYLVFSVKNISDQPIRIEANKIKMIFSNGLERYPDQDRFTTFQIEPNQKVNLSIRAYKKSDFNNQNQLKIEIPTIQQNSKKSVFILYQRDARYVEQKAFENYIMSISFDYGRSFLSRQTASQADQSSAGAFAFNIDFFGSHNHGLILGYRSFDYSLKPELKNQLNLTGNNFKASIGFGYLGYTFRKTFDDKNSLNSSLLIASTSSEFRDSSNSHSESQRSSNLGLRLEGNYLFSHITEGPFAGMYLINYGVDYFNISSLSNQFGDLSGSAGSVFVGFKIGI